jgi:hypothetical protein
MPREETVVEVPEAEQTASEFFDELKTIIYAMKALGLFPLQKRNPGWSRFISSRHLEFEVLTEAHLLHASSLH